MIVKSLLYILYNLTLWNTRWWLTTDLRDDWFTKQLVYNTTGLQHDWFTTRVVYNTTGLQHDWFTTWLVYNWFTRWLTYRSAVLARLARFTMCSGVTLCGEDQRQPITVLLRSSHVRRQGGLWHTCLPGAPASPLSPGSPTSPYGSTQCTAVFMLDKFIPHRDSKL